MNPEKEYQNVNKELWNKKVDFHMKSKSITWNHGIGEVVNSLISNGLEINSLNEYDYSPYNCFAKTVEISENKFRIKHLKNKIPMVYAIVTTKK